MRDAADPWGGAQPGSDGPSTSIYGGRHALGSKTDAGRHGGAEVPFPATRSRDALAAFPGPAVRRVGSRPCRQTALVGRAAPGMGGGGRAARRGRTLAREPSRRRALAARPGARADRGAPLAGPRHRHGARAPGAAGRAQPPVQDGGDDLSGRQRAHAAHRAGAGDAQVLRQHGQSVGRLLLAPGNPISLWQEALSQGASLVNAAADQGLPAERPPDDEPPASKPKH